ncbi:MAG: circadian clock protein KaiC, partial [Verrucomicrobiales bacterium]|nr:circadian clock protein KaiC [Verrucomicrobiales bacterium]
DSHNGYLNAMPDERFLSLHLHELLTFLSQRGVISIMTVAQHGLIGTMQSPVDVTYLADTVVLLRFFEADGRVKKALSVIKKRSGVHEDSIRELKMDNHGISVGQPLTEFRGVLTGVPVFQGRGEKNFSWVTKLKRLRIMPKKGSSFSLRSEAIRKTPERS